jgi:hypothetical protein
VDEQLARASPNKGRLVIETDLIHLSFGSRPLPRRVVDCAKIAREMDTQLSLSILVLSSLSGRVRIRCTDACHLRSKARALNYRMEVELKTTTCARADSKRSHNF